MNNFFFTYDFSSGAGNMEGDPLVMTGWKVISSPLMQSYAYAAARQAHSHPTRGQRGNIKNDLLPMAART